MTSLSKPTTFRIFDKEAEKVDTALSSALGGREKAIIKRLDYYQGNKCTKVLQTSNFPSRSIGSENGFVQTVVKCYNEHHNLIIRPDDVWAAIMAQFSFYVNKNAEDLRSKFVNYEGQKKLVVTMAGGIRTWKYDDFVKHMTKLIDDNLVDPEVKNWVLPNFSTTTDSDLVSVGVMFMAIMKKYMKYGAAGCWIPYITLEGSVDDWKNIQGRLEKLKEYKLEKWYDMLAAILEQFVDAKEGKIDLDFWQKICHWQNGGSGIGPWVSGWITAFCVFDKEGNWQGNDKFINDAPKPKKKKRKTVSSSSLQSRWSNPNPNEWPWLRINPRNVPTGIVEVEVELQEAGGLTRNSVMFAGHMAAEVMDDECTLKPVLGWAIALKPKNPKGVEMRHGYILLD